MANGGNKTTGANAKLTNEEVAYLDELMSDIELQLDEAPLVYNREGIEAEFHRRIRQWRIAFKSGHPDADIDCMPLMAEEAVDVDGDV